MIELQLYSPDEIDITIPLPTSWNELDGEEVRYLCSGESGGETLQDAQCRMVLWFIERRVNEKVKSKKEKISELTREQWLRLDKEALTEIIPVFEFIFKTAELTQNKIPFVEIDGIKYAGPKDAFGDTTAGEYETNLILLLKHHAAAERGDNEKAEEYLREMFKYAYRPYFTQRGKEGNGRGDKRVPFEDYESEMPNDKIPDGYVQAYKLYFGSCNNLLTKLFPAVYGGKPQAESGKQKASQADLMNFTRCIHAAAGPKNGRREDVRRLPIMELMFDMNEEAKAAAKLNAGL